MTDHQRLAWWCRRLLVAYPRQYRRERADEIIGTLLDAAGPGQRRPHPRDAANLVLRGLARRFAIPRGPAYLAAAAVAALFCGLGMAAGVATALSRLPASTPTAESALAVASIAVSADPSAMSLVRWFNGPSAADEAADPYRPPADFARQPGWLQVSVPADEGAIRAAHARLAAAGWQVTDLAGDGRFAQFWAADPDTVVRVSTVGSSTVESLLVDVHRRAFAWAGPVILTAGLLGFAGGWLLAGQTLRGFRRLGPRGRLTLVAFGGPGLLVATVPLLYAGILLTEEVVAAGWRAALAPRLATAFDLPPVTGFATLLLLGSVAVAKASPPTRTPVERKPGQPPVPRMVWRFLAGTMATAHVLLAVTSVLVIAWYLYVSSRVGVRPLNGRYDPKDLVPFGGSLLNPFQWGYLLVYLGYVLGWLVSPALLVVSVPLLVVGRALRLARTRIGWLLLLAAVATAVVPPALILGTTAGPEAMTWLLD